MRPLALALSLLLLAGCTSPAAEKVDPLDEEPAPEPEAAPSSVIAPSRPPPSAPPAAPPPSPPQPPSVPAPEAPRPPEPQVLRFALRYDRSIALLAPEETIPTEERVPEPMSGTDFVAGLPQGLAFEPFVSLAMPSTFEIVEPFELTLRIVSSAPAVAALPSEAGAPTIGVWFGTPDRHLAFLTTDVPTVLLPDEEHTIKLSVPIPEEGALVRAGDSFVISTYLSYQTADGSKVSWVVGGDEPAGFEIKTRPIELGFTSVTTVLDETAEAMPSPAFTANDPQPRTFEFDVPPGTRALVASLTGTPRAGETMDMDLTLVAGGEVVGGSYGPYAKETVVLGPTALAALGSAKLTARVVSGTSPTGGTFDLVVTAYVA